MKQLPCIICVFLLTIGISCQSDHKQEKETTKESAVVDSLSKTENALYKDVMAIHDEIMPAMSDILSLNKQLKAIGNEAKESGEMEKISELSKELEAANEKMMDWMREFNPDLDSMAHKKTMVYLKEEKERIEAVRQQMQIAMENAESYLADK